MGGAASKNANPEHFSIGDLLTNEDSVDMRKATIMLWRNREKPEVISELAEVLSEYSDFKTAFEGIEFYLPQLAHMIIHLEVDWPTAALEQFVLIVCQHSLHFALQLHFILVGAMEDYQLETPTGRSTAHGNPRYYRRCAKLLQNVHRCVVYGSPRVHQLEELYRSGKLTKTELEEMGIAERRFQAAQILDPPDPTSGDKDLSVLEGKLFYKRQERRSCCHLKRWKERWFKIQDRVLYCYTKQDGQLRRAIPLESAEVKVIDNPRHEYYFEVTAVSTGSNSTTFQLKAELEEDMQRWVKQIQHQSMAPTFHARGEEHMLYPAEFGRYQFFKSQRDFINRLTDISEEMRFLDRPIRTKCLKDALSKVRVPEAAYLPLCKSTDPWLRILRIIPEEARAFSTKARCPCLCLFEVERDQVLDVANYLHQRYGQLDEQDRTSEDGMSVSSITLEHEHGEEKGPNGPSSLVRNPSAVTSVQTLSAIKASARQHGQEAPLVLGRSLDDNERLPGEEGHLARKYSFNTITKNLTMSSPSLWRVSKPSIPADLRKFNDRLRDLPEAIRRRARSNSQQLDASKTSPVTLGGKLEMAFKRASSTATGHGDDHEAEETRIVPCYGEVWLLKRQRLMTESIYKEVVEKNLWDLQAVIIKSNDDVRQEVFIMQLISFFEDMFKQAQVPCWLRPYKIISTGNSTGLIAFVTDAISIDALKKSKDYPGTLLGHFEMTYGPQDSEEFKTAQSNFAESLAAYSLIAYLLGIKDRHNGNIMIDKKGHIIHIDFGFVLGIAPGGKFTFERPPFKLTAEMAAVLGGWGAPAFKYYQDLIFRAFKVARQHAETLLTLMEIMSFQSKFPCFVKMGAKAITGFKQRILYGQDLTDQQLERVVENLVRRSHKACGTNLYDQFQLLQNGLKP